jgi:hypothetical protein
VKRFAGFFGVSEGFFEGGGDMLVTGSVLLDWLGGGCESQMMCW